MDEKLKDNILYSKAYNYSLRVINVYKTLIDEKKEFVLSKQFLRCGTSIGANIAEANGAISKADFSSKISISYKESLENKYWLSLLKDSGYISDEEFRLMFELVDELSRIMFSILKKTRINNL